MEEEQTTNLLIAFHLYSNFFENENKISLIDRRDFKNIYLFKELFKNILDTNYNHKKVSQLTILARQSVKRDYYDYLTKEFEENVITDIKSKQLLTAYTENEDNRNKVINLFTETNASLSNYFFSYSLLSKFKNETYLEELLIEFHNYLSHLVQAIIDLNSYTINLQRANSHLHRAVLDALKVIIHDTKALIRTDDSLLNYFTQIRAKELNLIGILESDKKENYTKQDIQLEYYALVKKILQRSELQ